MINKKLLGTMVVLMLTLNSVVGQTKVNSKILDIQMLNEFLTQFSKKDFNAKVIWEKYFTNSPNARTEKRTNYYTKDLFPKMQQKIKAHPKGYAVYSYDTAKEKFAKDIDNPLLKMSYQYSQLSYVVRLNTGKTEFYWLYILVEGGKIVSMAFDLEGNTIKSWW